MLRHLPVEGHSQGLNAATNAQHGNLSVEGQSGDEQFGQVALGIHMAQLG